MKVFLINIKKIVLYGILRIAFLLIIAQNLNAQQANWVVRLHDQPEPRLRKFCRDLTGVRFRDSLAVAQRLDAMVGKLHTHGYLEAGVDDLQYEADTVWVKLHLGKRYEWGDIRLKGAGASSFTFRDTLFRTYRHAAFDYSRLEEFLENLLQEYENHGYPFVCIRPSEIRLSDGKVHGSWLLTPNSYYVWDTIQVKGPLKIAPEYLHRFLGIYPGKAYDESQFRAISNRIGRLSFAHELKPAEVELGKKTARVFTYLTKQQANQFDGIIGLLSNNRKSGKMELSGELKLFLVNSFGRGEQIRFNWQKLESKTQKLSTRVEYPYLFHTSLGMDVGFQLHKQDTTYLNTEMDLGLQFLAEGGNYLKLLVRLKNSSLLSTKSLQGATVLPEFADSRSVLYGIGIRFQNLDAPFNPRKGWEVRSEIATGNRKIRMNSRLPSYLYDEIDLKSLLVDGKWDVSRYLPFARRWTFRLRSQGGIMKAPDLFENELYRLGGLQTLRGFDEEALRASAFGLLTGELRFLPERNSAFFLFWDGGYYRKEIATGSLEDTPWGMGLGMNFQTGAGIFSLSYALGKGKEQPLQVRSAKIHFGFISRF